MFYAVTNFNFVFRRYKSQLYKIFDASVSEPKQIMGQFFWSTINKFIAENGCSGAALGGFGIHSAIVETKICTSSTLQWYYAINCF